MDRSADIARFESKFVPEPNSGCWLWLGGKNVQGYGTFNFEGRTRLAHRVALELYAEKPADGLDVDHLCRTRCCVNPDHLEAVSHLENVRRGEGNKRQLLKTHCPKGHPLSGENLYRYPANAKRPNGKRACRACVREYHARHQAKKRAA